MMTRDAAGTTVRLAYREARLAKYTMPREKVKPLLMNRNVRVRKMSDGGVDVLVVEELPGDPFKNKVRRRTYDTYSLAQELKIPTFGLHEVLKKVNLSKRMDFDAVVGEVDRVLEDVRSRVLFGLREFGEKHLPYGSRYDVPTLVKKLSNPDLFGKSVKDKVVPFTELEPRNYDPIRFSGSDFRGICEWEICQWVSDVDYRAAANSGWINEDMGDDAYDLTAYYRTTAKVWARKLFRILKEDPEHFASYDHTKFLAFLDSNRVEWEHVPSSIRLG